MKKIKAISLVMTISIMALIFFFSSQPSDASTEVSDGITVKLIEIFSPGLSGKSKAEAARELSFYVRKAAHFLAFTMLSISAITTVKSHFRPSNRKAVIITMLFCVIYACSDEFHQSFVSGRSMKATDVLIDSAGALSGIGIFFVLYRVFYKFVLGIKRRNTNDS